MNKTQGMMCRKCRFHRCLEEGMLPETALGKKDSSRLEDSSESPEYNEERDEGFAKSYISKIVSSPPILPQQPVFLNKVFSNYSRMRGIRQKIEKGMLEAIPSCSTVTEGILQNFTPCTTASISNIYRAYLPPMAEFIHSTFEEVHALPENEKWLLFGAFVFASWGLESCYRTVKAVPREKQDTVNILSERTFLDLDNMDLFLCDASTVMLVKEDIEKLVRRCMGRPRQKVVSMMDELDICDEEMAALIGLLFWSHTNEDLSDNVEKLARNKRDMIFEELHNHYILKETPNYAKRIGKLMCLYSAMLTHLDRLREDMEVLKIVDAFPGDDFFFCIMQGSYRAHF